MALTLGTALRLVPRSGRAASDHGPQNTSVAFVGAGGKTTAMFQLARELPYPCLVTCTTHLGAWQLPAEQPHLIATSPLELVGLGESKITVVTGPRDEEDRLTAVSSEVLRALRSASLSRGWPLLIEADGARQRALKAPRPGEPQVPSFVETAVVMAGMSGLNGRLDSKHVHRPELFGGIAGLRQGDVITPGAVSRVLASPFGGLAGLPSNARKVAILNQADPVELQAIAQGVAAAVGTSFDAVLVATAQANVVHAVFEPTAGIVLAAGGASRFGQPKQLLDWLGMPLVHASARVALDAGLDPVVVVTGSHFGEVEEALAGLPVILARNSEWEQGQASSIRVGLEACPARTASVIFLLADQPFVSAEVIRALVAAHAAESAAIVAPLTKEGRRGNPVLFDRETFADLRALEGDAGGRALFGQHRVRYVDWHDDRILRDIDTEEDYRRLQAELQR